jgi:hypothetical protein
MAQGEIGFKLRGDIGFHIRVYGYAVAAAPGGVFGGEAGKTLTARIAAETDAVGVDIGTRFAREYIVALMPVFAAEREVQAFHHPGKETADIEIAGGLIEPETTGIEAGGADAGSARQQVRIGDGCVQRMADVVVQAVITIGLRQIGIPVAEAGAESRNGGAVVDDAVDERYETIGIHRARRRPRMHRGADCRR